MATQSGNANGVQAVKRMELAFGDLEVHFSVNPSEYQQREPNKATLTHTKGGAWIDAWGAGVLEFHIRGITGGHRGDKGYQNWIKLRDCIRAVYDSIQDGQTITEYLRLYNYTDNEFWHCFPMPNGLELTRSKSNPLIYQYSLSLWGLSKIGETVQEQTITVSPLFQGAPAQGTRFEVDNSAIVVPEGFIGAPPEGKHFEYASSKPLIDTVITVPENFQGPFPQNVIVKTTSVTTSSGGGEYITTGYANPETVTAAKVTVSSRSQDSLVNICSYLASALKPLVGGDDGKIAPAAMSYVLSGILISPDGGITCFSPTATYASGVELPSIQPSGDSMDSILQNEMNFVPSVSQQAYAAYSSAKKYGADVLSANFSISQGSSAQSAIVSAFIDSSDVNSEFIQNVKTLESESGISQTDAGTLRVTLLEFMALYLEMSKYAQSQFCKISKTSTEQLIRNVETLILHFADSGNASTDDDNSAYIAYILRRFYTVAILINSEIAPYV